MFRPLEAVPVSARAHFRSCPRTPAGRPRRRLPPRLRIRRRAGSLGDLTGATNVATALRMASLKSTDQSEKTRARICGALERGVYWIWKRPQVSKR